MPYTPPAQQSPASSKPTTPLLTRNHSHFPLPSPSPRTSASRPQLPRSTSSTAYLQKHRRSPSWQQPSALNNTYHEDARPASADQVKNGNDLSSLRQSPPPVSDNIIPVGAIMSPPDSSSDEEDRSGRGRRRNKSQSYEELSEAIHRTLEVKRSGSPTGEEDSKKTENLKISIPEPDLSEHLTMPTRPALSQSARKISHSRSNTESAIELRTTQSARTSRSNSDDSDIDDEDGFKPPLLRKKSGELVKPALRASSRRRPSSMPGTPTYSKAVHFNDDIEQVRHFLQVDRPIAVSAGSSPADPFEDEAEFPFGFDENGGHKSTEWEINLANFPRESYERMSLPARVEKIFLSADNKTLIGTVAVANLAFHKLVVARFTLDYWKTTSEIVAEYNNDIRQKPRQDGYDQFNFNIKLADQAHLEKKTLLLCVRYNVNGQEFWDNNNDMNFSVDFTKKPKAKAEKPVPQQQGLGARPLGAIPRSRHGGSASVGRPRSIPSFEDDFSRGFDDDGTGPGAGIRLKKPSTSRQFLPDNLQRRQQSNGQPFGNRYDFGASLSAALSQAQATLGDRSGLPTKNAPTPPPSAGSTLAPRSGPSGTGTDSPRPDTLLADSKTLDSRAYQEFVSKFCFFGSAKAASQSTKSTTKPLTGDGAQDEIPPSSSSVTESNDTSGTNTPPTNGYPFPEKISGDSRASSQSSRSASPGPMTGTLLAERPTSPAAFGYPYHQNVPSGLQTPTAIRG